ncbi:DUF6639 family protein [Rhodoferax sp.]|uniref:DUF6639 family protein n=1 Tax=Rhodoferax sp. TaxID=50421 RepID=UPI0025E84711|nr:DUF6639 family protein [Rhodoferax sp.]MCM2340044.1 hypothetical protein [Rhodoferax sp.]
MKHWFQSADAVAWAVSAVAMGGGLWSSSASSVRAATIASCATPAMARIEVTCATKDQPVHSCEPADVKLACEGANDAIYFLNAQGFNTANRVLIVVAHQLPAAGTATAGGLYLDSPDGCHGDRAQAVHLLSYSEFKKFKNWFHIPIEDALYRSLAAHEVAHAISDCNFKFARPTIQAKEYMAYVTMFATMAPAVRARILRKSPGHGYEGDWQMSTLIYMADPMRFGVQAYRHFLKPDNGRRYLHAILAGKVMVE